MGEASSQSLCNAITANSEDVARKSDSSECTTHVHPLLKEYKRYNK